VFTDLLELLRMWFNRHSCRTCMGSLCVVPKGITSSKAGRLIIDTYTDRTKRAVLVVAIFFYLSTINVLFSSIQLHSCFVYLGGVCTLVGLTIKDYVGESVDGRSARPH